MRTSLPMRTVIGGAVFTVLAMGVWGSGRISAKEKNSQANSDDPTTRLYALLDSKYSGKLEDFYVLADVLTDTKNSAQPEQRVLRVDYGKDRAFGKLNIHVRIVGQVTPDQAKAYTPKQIYDFGESDSAKFTKTDPGPFGKAGDVYFRPASDGGPLGTSNVTTEVQTEYEHLLTDYLIPALEKKAGN